MNILGLETSCDETAAAVVRDGRHVLSNRVYSQIARHAPFGGVVPEIAARSHVEILPRLVREAVDEADCGWDGIDAVAVTRGPGLASSLLIGLAVGKALALRLDRPLLALNHLQAHVYSLFLGADAPAPEGICPLLVLLVSGGHTSLVLLEEPLRFRLIGETLDDAAGEALDKGAALLGLGYPGGPAIEHAARAGRPDAVNFPRGRIHARRAMHLDPQLCFSFSGVKTALRYYLEGTPPEDQPSPADLAASYQEAVLQAILDRLPPALERHAVKHLAAGGGVIRNRRLRDKLAQTAERHGVSLHLPAPQWCTDNAAMVAGLGGWMDPHRQSAGWDVDVIPGWPVDANPA